MPSPSWRAAARDLGSLVALLLLALLLRLPRLDSIPRYTDETGEVATALDIAFEGARPLVHNDAYRGPVWAYGLAGALRLFGPQPGLPRRYALTLSVLTVLATWALARGLVGPRAGWVAGLLQASAFAPIALESHVAWSNHATPLVVTLAALATWRGAGASVTDPQPAPAEAPVSGRQAPGFDSGHPVSGPATGRQGPGGGADRWLLLAGLLWGLALQTHPSVVAPLAGAGLWLLLRPGFRARLRRPAPYLALGLFLFALGPLIVHNLSSLRSTGDLASVEDATAESQPVNRDFGVASLAGNLVALAGQLGRAAGAGRPAEPGEPVPSTLVGLTDGLRPLVSLAIAGLLLAALARAALRGPTLPAALAWAGIAILPLVNRNYQSFYDMRYLGFLLPLAFVALAAWLAPPTAAAADSQGRSAPGGPMAWLAPSGRPAGLGSGRLPSLLLVALVGYSLLSVAAYYQREAAAGRSNEPMIAAADRLALELAPVGMAAARGAAEPAAPEAPEQIFIDKAMRPIKLEGGGDPVRAFGQLLRLRDTPSQVSDLDELRWFLQNDDRSRYWILAADDTASALLGEGFALRSLQQADGWQLLLRQPSPSR